MSESAEPLPIGEAESTKSRADVAQLFREIRTVPTTLLNILLLSSLLPPLQLMLAVRRRFGQIRITAITDVVRSPGSASTRGMPPNRCGATPFIIVTASP